MAGCLAVCHHFTACTPQDTLVPCPHLFWSHVLSCLGVAFRQLLRNLPPNEWVPEVEKVYGDDEEVKGMIKDIGKLMGMLDYYDAK